MKTFTRISLLALATLMICGNAPPPPSLYEAVTVCESKTEGADCRVNEYKLKGFSCSYEYERSGSRDGKCHADKIACPEGTGTCLGPLRCVFGGQ